MPQYAVLIHAAESAHRTGEDASTSAAIAECDAHADDLAAQAVMTAAWAFAPREEAVVLTAAGQRAGVVSDGPMFVAGVYLLEAEDLAAALATARTNPVLRHGGALEVRPVHSGGLVARD